MANNQDPGFYRRRVRDSLRKARDKAGLTQHEAAERLDWSMSKLVRIEAGTVGVSTTDLRALLQLYELDDPAQVNDLVEMARAARRQPWFTKYRSILNQSFGQYLGYESSAAVIRSFQPLTIPGLLQTEGYGRAVLEAGRASYVDQRLELRVTRQGLLDRDDRPDILYVLDEAVLRRRVGGAAVMREQLLRLRKLMEHPQTSIRVLPFTAGAHPSMDGPFTILEFADWDEDVLYQEVARGSITSREDQVRVGEYRESFDLLRAASLGEQESDELIDGLIQALEPADGTG
jgi:transcriptional regulator with XRE-family HTH domain